MVYDPEQVTDALLYFQCIKQDSIFVYHIIVYYITTDHIPNPAVEFHNFKAAWNNIFILTMDEMTVCDAKGSEEPTEDCKRE